MRVWCLRACWCVTYWRGRRAARNSKKPRCIAVSLLHSGGTAHSAPRLLPHCIPTQPAAPSSPQPQAPPAPRLPCGGRARGMCPAPAPPCPHAPGWPPGRTWRVRAAHPCLQRCASAWAVHYCHESAWAESDWHGQGTVQVVQVGVLGTGAGWHRRAHPTLLGWVMGTSDPSQPTPTPHMLSTLRTPRTLWHGHAGRQLQILDWEVDDGGVLLHEKLRLGSWKERLEH